MMDPREVSKHHREGSLCFAEPLGERVAILSRKRRRSGIASGLGAEEGAGRLLKLLKVSKNVTRNGGDNGVNEPKGNDPMSDGDYCTAGRTAPRGKSYDYF